MNITYYGHSCFGIETEGLHLLFDPFISPNEKAAHIDPGVIPCDFILLSHAHGDHMADAEAILKRTGATLVSNYEICTWFSAKGCKKYHPMNIGGQWTFPFGKLRMVHAAHSSTFPDGSGGGSPGGFILQLGDKRVYYSGDTALTLDMQLIGAHWTPDLAFLSIGDNFTMGPEDALLASHLIKCNEIVGMHYDTFGYIVIDHELVQQRFEFAGKRLRLPAIGETWTWGEN